MMRTQGAFALFLLLAITLPAGSAADYWVDATTGSDLNPGSEALPFATITHAVTVAGPTTIHVEPGIYDEALTESFPIFLATDQRLVGDPENQGAGVLPTRIVGHGAYAGVSGVGSITTVVCAESSSIEGFQIDPATAQTTLYAAVVIVGVEAEVSDNKMGPGCYAGVYLENAQDSWVEDNLFGSSSYGVFMNSCPGAPVIFSNTFVTPALAINMQGIGSNSFIQDNLFQSGRVCIQVQRGTPLIERNVFEAGSGTVYGGVFAKNAGTNPVIRSNIFRNALGIRISTEANPDIGRSGDPGLNDFSEATGVCIWHEGSADVSAIGNAWPGQTPEEGVDVVVSGTGSLILFAVPVEALSVGSLKTNW